MADKNFIKGWARAVQWQYGEFFNLRIHAKAIAELPQDDEWYVSITMSKVREPKERGYTHYLVENTYQKDKQVKQEEQQVRLDDDLPF